MKIYTYRVENLVAFSNIDMTDHLRLFKIEVECVDGNIIKTPTVDDDMRFLFPVMFNLTDRTIEVHDDRRDMLDEVIEYLNDM